jgi:hypothetical protein
MSSHHTFRNAPESAVREALEGLVLGSIVTVKSGTSEQANLPADEPLPRLALLDASDPGIKVRCCHVDLVTVLASTFFHDGMFPGK